VLVGLSAACRVACEYSHLVIEHPDSAHVACTQFIVRQLELFLHVAPHHPAKLVDVDDAFPRVLEGSG
jgi:hypothetical protein